MSVSALGGRLPRPATYRLGFFLAAVGTALLGLARSLPVAAAAFALIGGGQIVANVSGTTILQEYTDDRLRGRVFGIYQTVVHVCSLLAAALAGGLADPLGAATVIVAVGALEVCLSPLSLVLVREGGMKGGLRRPATPLA